MNSNKDSGKINIELNDKTYSVQYKIENLTDTNYDLTIWYNGKCIKERCPRYAANPVDDIESPHGFLLLEKLLKNE